MKKQLVFIIISIIVSACSDGERDISDSNENATDSVVSSSEDSLTPEILHAEYEVVPQKVDTLSLPMSVNRFRSLNFQNQLSENDLLTQKDSLFESSYVPGDSVLWLYYNYGNSEIVKLGDSSLLYVVIKDNELLEGFFMQLGMSYQEFKNLFTDLDSLYNKNYDKENPLENGGPGHVWFQVGELDDPVGWLFGFKNDSLYFVHYSVFYEY